VTLESLLAIIVFLMMAVVGTDISRAQLAASLRMRRALVGGTLGQLVVLPALAVLLIWLLQPLRCCRAGCSSWPSARAGSCPTTTAPWPG